MSDVVGRGLHHALAPSAIDVTAVIHAQESGERVCGDRASTRRAGWVGLVDVKTAECRAELGGVAATRRLGDAVGHDRIPHTITIVVFAVAGFVFGSAGLR